MGAIFSVVSGSHNAPKTSANPAAEAAKRRANFINANPEGRVKVDPMKSAYAAASRAGSTASAGPRTPGIGSAGGKELLGT